MPQVIPQAGDWPKDQAALRDPRWDFRTIDSLARETGLSRERVKLVLERHAREIRKANVTDRDGKILYTLASRQMGLREFLANTRAFITKTSSA